MSQAGLENKLLHVRKNHYSDIVKEILTAKVLVIGSPTLNEGIFPSVAQLLVVSQGSASLEKEGSGLRFLRLGGEAIKALESEMKAMGIAMLEPGLGVIYVPKEEDLKSCVQLGERIAANL